MSKSSAYFNKNASTKQGISVHTLYCVLSKGVGAWMVARVWAAVVGSGLLTLPEAEPWLRTEQQVNTSQCQNTTATRPYIVAPTCCHRHGAAVPGVQWLALTGRCDEVNDVRGRVRRRRRGGHLLDNESLSDGSFTKQLTRTTAEHTIGRKPRFLSPLFMFMLGLLYTRMHDSSTTNNK